MAGGVDITFAEPIGVVGVIVPWNFPMPIASWGFAPALAAGNTVALKPASLTPLTALRLAELAREAGIPEDVFQVVPGEGGVVGQRLIDHPAVGKIVFTGSTEVGRRVMAGCAAQVKRVTLELGGKSANVVFADADLERAAATAPYAVFDNAGQDCCARSRILVQRGVYDRFMSLLADAVRGVRVGDPALGADRDGAADLGRAAGPGGVLCRRSRRWSSQGACPDGAGFWFAPTVLAPVDAEDRVWREEIFGPVLAVAPFDDEARRDPAGQRQRLRAAGLDLDPRRRPGVAGGAGHGDRQHLGELALLGALQRPRSAGSSSRASAASSGPDALAAFTETKNVFVATELR